MELFPGELPKPETMKEVRPVGEDKDLFQSQDAGFFQATLDQASADAPALVDRKDHQGTDFSQVFPEHMQRRKAQDGPAAVLAVDEKVPDKAVEFGQGTGQDVPLAGVFRQETVDFRDFIQPGFADHGALTPTCLSVIIIT